MKSLNKCGKSRFKYWKQEAEVAQRTIAAFRAEKNIERAVTQRRLSHNVRKQ